MIKKRKNYIKCKKRVNKIINKKLSKIIIKLIIVQCVNKIIELIHKRKKKSKNTYKK